MTLADTICHLFEMEVHVRRPSAALLVCYASSMPHSSTPKDVCYDSGPHHAICRTLHNPALPVDAAHTNCCTCTVPKPLSCTVLHSPTCCKLARTLTTRQSSTQTLLRTAMRVEQRQLQQLPLRGLPNIEKAGNNNDSQCLECCLLQQQVAQPAANTKQTETAQTMSHCC